MNIIQKQQQRELQKIDICVDIIKNARNELYLSMRFFDVVLHRLELMPDINIQGVGTDGFTPPFGPSDFMSENLYSSKSTPLRALTFEDPRKSKFCSVFSKSQLWISHQ